MLGYGRERLLVLIRNRLGMLCKFLRSEEPVVAVYHMGSTALVPLFVRQFTAFHAVHEPLHRHPGSFHHAEDVALIVFLGVVQKQLCIGGYVEGTEIYLPLQL